MPIYLNDRQNTVAVAAEAKQLMAACLHQNWYLILEFAKCQQIAMPTIHRYDLWLAGLLPKERTVLLECKNEPRKFAYLQVVPKF
jgi:hypothetical protein